MPNARDAMKRRLRGITRKGWASAMVCMIGRSPYFRWHDSGDIQSMGHLEKIVEVCRRTPGTRHWIPTKEYGVVRQFLRNGGVFPSNLAVRVSCPMVDAYINPVPGLPFSAVNAETTGQGHICPGECGDCRKCWDTGCSLVTYKKH